MNTTINIRRLHVHVSAPADNKDAAALFPVVVEISEKQGIAKADFGHTKVLADGTRIPGADPRTDHVAVIDHATGLMWSVESLGDPSDADDGISQEQCIQRCADLRLLGHDDWRLPTRAELAALVDDTRHEPAIDTALFPRVKSRWHWTSTPAAWSSASAWFVYFGGGGVYSSPAAATGSRWPCVVPVSNWPL